MRCVISWSFTIARIFGIRIRVHLFMVLFVAAMVLSDFVRDSSQAGIMSLGFYSTLFISVLLHEFGHCFAAAHYGGRPRQVLVWFLGGLATIEDAPQLPWPQSVIALGGPAVNLILGGLLLVVLLLLGIPLGLMAFEGLSWPEIFLKQAFFVNLLLLVFNLIPALPLDGGSVLRWGLVERLGFIGATRFAAFVGQGLAILLGIAALVFQEQLPFYPLFAVAIAVVIFLECERQKRMAQELEGGPMGYWSDEESEYSLHPPPPPPTPSFFERLRAKREARRREQDVRAEVEMREKVDELLDKISLRGMQALTDKERSFLRDASKRFGNKKRG